MSAPPLPWSRDAGRSPRRPGPALLTVGTWALLLAATLAAPALLGSAHPGEDLTRNTVRLALVYYGVAAALMLHLEPGEWQTARGRAARWCWTLAWAAYLLHLGMAAHHYDGWSHPRAVERVERTTHFGPGIYVSHLFTLLWTLDVLYWWLCPQGYARRPAWVGGLLHGFMAFIIFCATVVYETGPIRWAGLTLLAGLGALVLRRWARRPTSSRGGAGNPGAPLRGALS